MNDSEIKISLKKSERTTINIRKTAQKRFAELKGSRPEWEFFDVILEFYEAHHKQEGEGTDAVATPIAA